MSTSCESGPRSLKCPNCGASLPPAADDYTICRYCGSSLIWSQLGTEGDALAAATPQTVARGMRLKQFTCTDTEGTGLEVFRMLVPAGWQTQGGCRWLMDNPGMPAVIAVQVANPQGAEAFEILPNMNFTWNNNPLSRMMFPVGSRYFGAEVRPPMDVRQALAQLVLPRYRAGVQNLQIIREEPVPELPQVARSEAAVSGGWAEGGKVRIHYTREGAQIEEEIFALVEIFRNPMVDIVTWFVDFVFAFRAAAGRLDATADLFKGMVGSFRPNPHWYAAFKAIAVQLCQQQIQHIRHVGQIGQIYAQTGSEMREQNLNDWYARQSIYDRLATDRSRSIRGVDGFFDPHRQETVELPAGYGHAWANNLGEYILTDQVDFNPNIGSNLHWEPMPQQ